MITPDYLNEVITETEEYVAEMNNYLLSKIAKLILGAFTNNQGNLIIPATQSDLKLLMKSGMLYEDIEKEIEKRLPQLKKVIHEAFLKSANEIAGQNNDFARQLANYYKMDSVEIPKFDIAGITPTAEALSMTPAEIRLLENMYRRTNHTVVNMTRSTAKLSEVVYTNACDMAYVKAQRGIPVGQAITEAITEASEQGISVVEYKTGKIDKAEVAIARAVRTGINQSNSEIVLKRCAELGMNFVKVSEHLGARVTKFEDYTNHAHWQGKVYKLDWNNSVLKDFAVTQTEEKEMTEHGFAWLNEMRDYIQDNVKASEYNYPDFIKETGYGDILGLCGINCRHTFFSWNPMLNIDKGQQISEEDSKKRYELEQKQRAMERRMREINKELQAQKMNDTEEGKKRVKALRSRLKDASDKYMDFCKTSGLKPRNYALKIK